MICLVLTGKSLEENSAIVSKNRAYIDIVELRIDFLESTSVSDIQSFPLSVDLPVILTCRRKSDGGVYQGGEKQRLALLEEAIEGNFAYIDIEEDIKRSTVEQKAREKGVSIIRSYHDFSGIPSDIFHRIHKIASRGDIPKMAVTVTSVLDLITLFRVKEELTQVPKKIVVGMGDFGLPSRILYKRVGSLLTYCAEKAVAPGQISAKEMKNLYRADTIDERTRIYGVIGNPVLHSLSPQLQNPGFKEINFNAVYLPILVDSVRSFFILAEMLQITGVSVTVPHKQAVLPYLGKITREVKQIGSCNTVCRAKNLWMGTNTDYYGFIEPLLSEIENNSIQSALVVGAGGAARSVVWALRNHQVKVIIVNRDVERAKKLAQETMSLYDSLDHAPLYKDVDLIVQTTTVGMVPYEQDDPIPKFPFSQRHFVYELVYKPHQTKMVKRALQEHSTIYYGIDMLIRQGKLQFETFTGYHYPKRLEVALQLKED